MKNEKEVVFREKEWRTYNQKNKESRNWNLRKRSNEFAR